MSQKTTNRRNEGASEPGDQRPVERQEAEAKASVVTEQRVDGVVLRRDPAHPAEDAETGEEEAGDEVPKCAADGDEKEELLTRDVLRLLLAPAAVERVEQRARDERGRPDHARGPDEELARDSRPGISDHLGREGEKELVADGGALVVEHALHGDDIGLGESSI